MSELQSLRVPPANGKAAQAVLVILHGWGANAFDVQALARFVNLPGVEMFFPDAPFPHPQAPGGKMWYDFPANFGFQTSPGFADRSDLTTSRKLLKEFLKALPDRTGVPLDRTFLGGFSQGGAMTLDVGLSLPLAGLLVLSGYLHAPLQPQRSELPPVLLVHGRQDLVVPLAAAQQTRDALQALGVNLRYQEYTMGHEISPIVLQQMQIFVKDLLTVNQ